MGGRGTILGMSTEKPSPLTLSVEQKGDAAIVTVTGKLTIGNGDYLYKPVCELMTNHKRIILDLGGLTHMDSMGLGTLVRLYVHSKTTGATIELRNLGKKVKDLMIMTNLLPVFATVGETRTWM